MCVCVYVCKIMVCTCMCVQMQDIYISIHPSRPEEDASVLLCHSPCFHEAMSLGEPRAKLAAVSPPLPSLYLPSTGITGNHSHAQHVPSSGMQTQASVQQALVQLSLQPECRLLCMYQQGMINYFSKCLSDSMGVILSISVLIKSYQFSGVESCLLYSFNKLVTFLVFIN